MIARVAVAIRAGLERVFRQRRLALQRCPECGLPTFNNRTDVLRRDVGASPWKLCTIGKNMACSPVTVTIS